MLNKICQNIDKISNYRSSFLWFLFIWFIINLVQSFFTELAHDEAYYWMYSRDLEWGYFDHPSVIAVFVRIGYLIFPNELGVRLMTVISGTVTLFLVFQILKNELKSLSLLIIILSSIILVQTHIGGFLAIPDAPLVFFATLFFYVYKKYVSNDSIKLAFYLGVISSLMLNSKYHGVLVLFFTLISNLSLLKRKSFWIVPLVIVLAMLPHLFWQIKNDFPTFGYHLVGRSSAYSIDRTLNYLGGQFLIAGPLTGIILFYHAFKLKVGKDLFLRAMKFNLYGFLGFFFVSSFKGHVEAHWTAIAIIPLIILSYNGIVNSSKAKKWLQILFVPTFILFLFIRAALIFNIMPFDLHVAREFFGWDKWAQQITDLAKGRKVIFINSFQFPSKYAFYSKGEFTHSLNSIHYRQNHFDLWDLEKELQSEDVLIIGEGGTDTLFSEAIDLRYRTIDNFKSYYDIKIDLKQISFVAKPGEEVNLEAMIINTRDSELNFIAADTNTKPEICISWHNGKTWSELEYLQPINYKIPALDSLNIKLTFHAPEFVGSYYGYISIVNDSLNPSFNSKRIGIRVKGISKNSAL